MLFAFSTQLFFPSINTAKQDDGDTHWKLLTHLRENDYRWSRSPHSCVSWVYPGTRRFSCSLWKIIRRKMNIQKSIVILIGLTQVSQWLSAKGCQMLAEWDIIKYLGAPIEIGIQPHHIHNFFLDKVCKRFYEWPTKHISFAGKLILIRQVLQEIPTFHLMYIHFNSTLAIQLQSLFKDFLWGFTKEGTHKIPLISWGKMTGPYNQDKFGIKQFFLQWIALLVQ